MNVIEVTRNREYFASLTPLDAFIWTGYTKHYEFTDNWGTNLGDEIVATGRIEKVLQVSRDYLNKYILATSLLDCYAQEASYYFDRTLQQIFVHTEHVFNPMVAVFDYGYALGMCSSLLGVTYIDNYEYLPLIKSSPDIEQEADTIGSAQPTGMTGTLTLNNVAVPDPVTTIPRGELDFLLTESVYGNDVFVYDYSDSTLTPTGAFFIEEIEISQDEISFNLQDKRFA